MAALDAFKQSLTVRDLLTMRTGFDWSDNWVRPVDFFFTHVAGAVSRREATP